MEQKLLNWLRQFRKPVSSSKIRQKALEYSSHPEQFRASKGWLEKFKKRHHIP